MSLERLEQDIITNPAIYQNRIWISLVMRIIGLGAMQLTKNLYTLKSGWRENRRTASGPQSSILPDWRTLNREILMRLM